MIDSRDLYLLTTRGNFPATAFVRTRDALIDGAAIKKGVGERREGQVMSDFSQPDGAFLMRLWETIGYRNQKAATDKLEGLL